jgi:ATP-binding cassette subfamily B protein
LSAAVWLGGTDRELAGRLPFVAQLQPELAQLVVNLFRSRSYEFGEEIVSEGDEADGMYVLASGSARVVTRHAGDEVTLARLLPGQWFGEAALLSGTARNATVRASEKSRTLFLDRNVFEALLVVHPEIRRALDEQDRVQQLNRLLRTQAAFDDLSMEATGTLLPLLRPVEAAPGDELLRQGDPGSGLYIVAGGRLEAVRHDEGLHQTIGYFTIGDIFGERSLVFTEPCVATVRALSPSSLWFLDAVHLPSVSEALPEFARRLREIAEGRDFRAAARVPLDFADEILPGGLDGSESSLAVLERDLEATDGKLLGVENSDDSRLVSETAPPTQPSDGTESGPCRRGILRPRRRFPIVYQIDEMDCGVACLAMVASWHGNKVSTAALRDQAGTDVSGTTLRAISAAGRYCGLDVQAMKVSKDRVGDLPLPAIVHWEANHWVVLTRASADKAEVADPAVGLRRMTRRELEAGWDGFAAVVRPSGLAPQLPAGAPNLRWLLPFLSAHRRALLLALGFALVAAGCEVGFPLVVEAIVNDVIAPHSESIIDLLGLVMLALLLGGTLTALLQRLSLVDAAARFDVDTLDFVTERLLKLPMSYFAVRRLGDIERRLGGVREIRRIVVELGIEALSASTQIVAGIAIMFVLSPLLAGIFLLAGPLYALAMRYSARRLRPLYASIEESFGRYMSDQIDLLKGIESVKSSGKEEGLRARLQQVFSTFTSRTVSSQRTIARYGSVLQLVSLLTYGLFVFLGAIEVHHHNLSVGAFVAFTTLVMLITVPLVTILSIWDEVQMSAVLLNRIADVLEHEPEQSRPEELRRVPSLEGRVQLVDVTYQPPNASRPILSGFSLDVEPGTTVGIVGRSGSGKSTLLRLLAGLIEPTSGRILFDRVDVGLIDYGELRRRIGVVLQQPYVFSATIAENIALGEDDPDESLLKKAASIADIAELVDRLPLGYDTPVGDKGLPLSGGQAQRLTIARALYGDPPVLLFDEATSALDSESEAIVKRNINRLLKGRTAFVAAHRLSTVRDADQIIVLDSGRLVERGTHEELMERKGIYFFLYSQQASAE